MTTWAFSHFLSGLVSAPLCGSQLFVVTVIFCLEGLLCPWSPQESWPSCQVDPIKSQHREQAYVGSQAQPWDPAKANSPCFESVLPPEGMKNHSRALLAVCCWWTCFSSTAWIQASADPYPCLLLHSLPSWYNGCLRQEQLAQLILLGIASAASQTIGDSAGLSEIAVCGKEIREANSLLFTQRPTWVCKSERGQSSYTARVKI